MWWPPNPADAHDAGLMLGYFGPKSSTKFGCLFMAKNVFFRATHKPEGDSRRAGKSQPTVFLIIKYLSIYVINNVT